MREFINIAEARNPEEIRDFGTQFNDPKIVTRVQTQSARKNPAWKKRLVTFMKKYDFSLIGAGVNGAVFQNPKYPFVLKVYRTDQGFDEWLYFVQTHQDNPFVPKVRGKTVKINNIFSAVRLEPLKPCDQSAANDLVKRIDSVIDYYSKIVDLKKTEPHLAEVAKFMREWQQVSDLSAHNIMQRPNGELVIIDPIYIEPGQQLEW